MNSTSLSSTFELSPDSILTGSGYALFMLSEILPFLKNRNNGVLHSIVSLLRGSQCVVNTILSNIEPVEEDLEESESVEPSFELTVLQALDDSCSESD